MSPRSSRLPRGDVAVGVAALVVAGVYAFFAFDIPHSLLSDPVGAAGLPDLYAIALGSLALLLTSRSLAAKAPVEDVNRTEADRLSWKQHLRALGLLLPGVIYLLLISSVGYFAAIFLLIIGVALYAGARPGMKLLTISVVGALVMWIIFDRLFKIPLPTGSLWSAIFR